MTTTREARYEARCQDISNCTETHWRGEVTTTDDGGVRWSSNSLRFHSREEALADVVDLSGRWMLVKCWRAVDDTVPEHQPYEAGQEDGGW